MVKIAVSHTILSLLGLALILGGCGSMTTRKDFYDPITAHLRAGQYDSATVAVEAALQDGKYGAKDRVVYFIDAGLSYHYAGLYDSANLRLQAAERAAEELWTKSISRAAASLLLNDNVLEYAGEDYEVLYTNVIGALNYLHLAMFDDALVEVKRANMKLESLEQKYIDLSDQYRARQSEDSANLLPDYEPKTVRFHNGAFARYLSMHLYAADGKWDDARIDYDLLADAFVSQPSIYNFAMPEVRWQADSSAVLSVVALAGLAPVKEALNLRIRTDKQLNLVQILYDDPQMKNAEYGHLPISVSEDYYFKFAMPQLVDRPSRIARIDVYVDDELLGELGLVEDVGAVARETFAAKRSWILLRSVARAVAKGLTAHRAKKKLDTGGLGGWLKKAAVDVVTDLTENADLRCARLLPGRIFVRDFSLPEGEYDLRVEFVDHDNLVIGAQSWPQYSVTRRGPNLVEAVSLE